MGPKMARPEATRKPQIVPRDVVGKISSHDRILERRGGEGMGIVNLAWDTALSISPSRFKQDRSRRSQGEKP